MIIIDEDYKVIVDQFNSDVFLKTFEIIIYFFSVINIRKKTNKQINSFFMIISDEQDCGVIVVQLRVRALLISMKFYSSSYWPQSSSNY
jgi:hypothetical protein